MKKYSLFIPILLVLSLVFPQSTPLLAASQTTPTVVVTPNTLAPDSDFTATAKGFTPSSTVSITINGQMLGVDLYFDEIKKETDTTGTATFAGHVPPTDTGTMSFDFTDTKGLTAKGTYAVQGGAPRKFLFGASVAVTDAAIQVGITGVGWKKDQKKSITGFSPTEKRYVPEFIDLCAGGQCPERDDALKLVLTLSKDTEPGIHTFRIGEEGGAEDKETKVEIPLTDENKDKKERTASIFLVDPPAATVDIPSIAVRGSDWGPYDARGAARAWLVDPDTEELFELDVDRNYRDCSFVNTNSSIKGACKLETDELFLRLEIPEALALFLKPKTYAIYVRTDNKIHALASFTLLGKPPFEKTEKTQLAIVPEEGPYGTHAVLFGAGFTRGEGLSVRFDGIKISVGGYLSPNPDGTFDNVGLTIPASQTKTDGKVIAVAPGKHTIEVSNDNGQRPVRASVTFTIIDKTENQLEQKKKEQEEQKKRDEALKKEEQLKKEKEQAEKEQARVEKERIELEKKLKQKQEEELKKKSEADKERLRKEEEELKKKLEDKKKQEQQKEQKIEDVKKKQEDLADSFCDLSVPITFQPGCVQKTKKPIKNIYDGVLCDADLPITFQPGCIAQKPLEQMSPFKGKECSTSLPITFQPGCIAPTPPSASIQYYAPDSKGKPCSSQSPIVFQPGCIDQKSQTNEQKPSAQLYAPDSAGKPCRSDIAITFQPGCMSAKPTEQMKPFAGKTCDPNLPLVWQDGCVQQKTPTQSTAQNTTSQNTSSPTAPTKKCDPTVPHYTQIGCVE